MRSLWLLAIITIGVISFHMSKKFWDSHSIKGQTPQHRDSLISKLRAGRVDVSRMSPKQLEAHMAGEALLRKDISKSSGFPEIMPDSYDDSNIITSSPVQRQVADATLVRKPKK